MWYTRTFRGGSPSRRPGHPRGGFSHPHNLLGRRGGPPACVLGGGRVSKYSFVAPRATAKLSILAQSTLAGFLLDGGAHAPSGGGRQDGALHTLEGGSATHTTFQGAGWVRITRVNSRRFSIGLWCTSTIRGGSPRRRPAHTGGGVSHPHNLPGRRGVPHPCMLGGGRVSKYSFVAPRATPEPSVLPESTLVGFPLDCGAHAPSEAVCPVGTPGTREGGQPPTQSSRAPRGPPRVCAWWGTRFKIFLRGPPGYRLTVHIARVNSRRFSIGLWCTSTFRGGSPRRRPAHTGGGVSHPHNLPGRRGVPHPCMLGGGRVSKYSFVAPRATAKPSILTE